MKSILPLAPMRFSCVVPSAEKVRFESTPVRAEIRAALDLGSQVLSPSTTMLVMEAVIPERSISSAAVS